MAPLSSTNLIQKKLSRYRHIKHVENLKNWIWNIILIHIITEWHFEMSIDTQKCVIASFKIFNQVLRSRTIHFKSSNILNGAGLRALACTLIIFKKAKQGHYQARGHYLCGMHSPLKSKSTILWKNDKSSVHFWSFLFFDSFFRRNKSFSLKDLKALKGKLKGIENKKTDSTENHFRFL